MSFLLCTCTVVYHIFKFPVSKLEYNQANYMVILKLSLPKYNYTRELTLLFYLSIQGTHPFTGWFIAHNRSTYYGRKVLK